jgi:acyl transferase domain-containing protein
VLEEYTAHYEGFRRLHSVCKPILISGETSADLLTKVQEAVNDLRSGDPQNVFNTLSMASAQTEIPENLPRLGFVAESPQEAQKFLEDAAKLLEKQPDAEAWDHPRGITFRATGNSSKDQVVALFPGQGSQYLNMASELVINFLPFLEAFEEMDELFKEEGQINLTNVVYPIPAFTEEDQKKQVLRLRETDYAQAAIGMVSFGLFRILQQAGFNPDMAAGHSFGELTALWAGGAIDDDTFLRLVKARGSAMRPPEEEDFDAGTMAAIKGPLVDIEKAVENLDGVIIANQNSTTQAVLAGATQAIKTAEESLTEAGFKVTPLPVSAAFHTPLVEHASIPFAKAVKKEKFSETQIPVFSNTTGTQYPEDTDQIQEILSNHILNPVIFKTQIEEIYQKGGRVFVEVGPRQILGNLVKDILEERPHEVVSINPSRDKSSDRQFREAVTKLRVIGLPIGEVDPYQMKAESSGSLV